MINDEEITLLLIVWKHPNQLSRHTKKSFGLYLISSIFLLGLIFTIKDNIKKGYFTIRSDACYLFES